MQQHESLSKGDDELTHTLYAWLGLPGHRERRSFLEAHPEILDAKSDDILATFVTRYIKAKADEIVHMLYEHLDLLRDIRLKGASEEVIRTVYVDRYGGLVLDLPQWLEIIFQQLAHLSTKHDQKAAERCDLLYKAMLQARSDPSVSPETLAELQKLLAIALWENRVAGHAQIYEEIVSAYQGALLAYTQDRYPRQYAMAQYNLGSAYYERIAGRRRSNLELAIKCYQAALQVYTCEIFPEDWAATQYNLGCAYRERIEGERHVNLEKAIACYEAALQVRSHTSNPVKWAAIQHNLGLTYSERMEGERRANLESAIACYQAALQVYTRNAFPNDWARIQDSLGSAYRKRIQGEQRTNLEQAIACYQASLQIHIRTLFPKEWATSQHNLGNAYYERMEGERRANLESAIACHQDALQVFTHDTFPLEWARIQHSLGSVYVYRLEGERRTNLEQAIACYQAAFQVYTYDAFPVEWARIQQSLGTVYRERLEGERVNLEQAIACYQAALTIYTQDAFPGDWASIQYSLGITYEDRIAGERRINLERAIACYEACLQVYTRDAFPNEWARAHYSLGNAYSDRVEGKQSSNLERAIASYNTSLQIWTQDTFPEKWAKIQHSLGYAYLYHIELGGERYSYLEQARACYERALMIYTQDTFPVEWASTQHNLGNVFAYSIRGERGANLESAIVCYEAALQVRTPDTLPIEWAATQHNLGIAYRERIEGERYANLEQAIKCCEGALQVRTSEAFPRDHRRTQLSLALAQAERRDWKAAHAAYTAALTAEEILIRLGTGTTGRDAILAEGRDAAICDGFALTRLGQMEAATVVIERGRVRGLAEVLALDAADPKRISDMGRRTRYETARQAFIRAQAVLNDPPSLALSESEQRHITLERTETYHCAKETFDEIVAEIRTAQDPPDFLDDMLEVESLLRVGESKEEGHALVYLAATPWGGIALAILGPHLRQNRSTRFVALDLPALTDSFVDSLIQTKLDKGTGRIIGGYVHAQEGSGYRWLRHEWAGETFRQSIMGLHTACSALGKESTLSKAAHRILEAPALAHLVDQPLDQLATSEEIALANTLSHYFLQLELQRCIERLAETAIHPLVSWLLERGVTSLTLIPCGALAAFPLTAIKLADGRTVGETLPTSVALSARSILPKEEIGKQRRGVYALGDSRPTHQELPWGEAEAHTLVKVARSLGLPAEARVHERARRTWLVQSLQIGDVVHASCHGKFDSNNFLQSSLQLAQGKRLTLAEALNRKVDLQGLRLLILSACQTAILDLRGARDEVRSLAAGMIQAGARAVLAALWSVDDKATYLLMVRFAQEWFPRMHQEPPAAALARAQSWLKTVTKRQLQQWQATRLSLPTMQERRKAGSVTPERDPWAEETSTRTDVPMLAAVRGRGDRYDLGEAEILIRASTQEEDLDACPYEDPIYWAGFQIIGW